MECVLRSDFIPLAKLLCCMMTLRAEYQKTGRISNNRCFNRRCSRRISAIPGVVQMKGSVGIEAATAGGIQDPGYVDRFMLRTSLPLAAFVFADEVEPRWHSQARRRCRRNPSRGFWGFDR